MVTVTEKKSDYEKPIPIAQLQVRQVEEVSGSSLRNWAVKGYRRRDGQIVKLQVRRLGCRFFCSQKWLDEFYAAVAAE